MCGCVGRVGSGGAGGGGGRAAAAAFTLFAFQAWLIPPREARRSERLASLLEACGGAGGGGPGALEVTPADLLRIVSIVRLGVSPGGVKQSGLMNRNSAHFQFPAFKRTVARSMNHKPLYSQTCIDRI